jgi:hypothetical protein
MISSEVQRTLVKSPPELWAELSDPAALARHLGELGDIRIVRTEPERTVEWTAKNTTGTVSIKPSGWGTKVTLSVTREAPPVVEAEAAPAPEAEDAPETEDSPETAPEAGAPAVAEAASEAEATSETDAAPEAQAPFELEPALETVNELDFRIEPETAAASEPESQPEPRRGFFARLFGRRRREAPSSPAKHTVAAAPTDPAPEDFPPSIPNAPDAFAAVREVLAPETLAVEYPFVAAPEPKEADIERTQSKVERSATEPDPNVSEPNMTARESEPDTGPEQADDISAELLAAEETSAAEVTAVLTAVLDRLGAAHHRPFSRS